MSQILFTFVQISDVSDTQQGCVGLDEHAAGFITDVNS